MTHLLPPSLLRLFAPRPPLEYIAPIARFDPSPSSTPLPKDPSRISNRKRCRAPLTGVAATLERIQQDAADRGESTDDIASADADAHYTLARVTLAEIAAEKRRAAKEATKRKGLEEYNPHSDPKATSDPYKTLFLSRLSYETTEDDLKREFDMYGPITTIRVVKDKQGKSRGYAFIEYERERDMKAAWKDAEGIKIAGRRIMVDVERGRCVKDWKPTRLGGGLGGSARKPKKIEPPPEPAPVIGGGFRGGRGGFRGGGFAPRGGPRGGGRVGGGFGGPPRGFDNGYPPRGPPSNSRYGGPPGGGGRDRDYPPPTNGSSGGGWPPRSYDDPNSGPPAKRSRY